MNPAPFSFRSFEEYLAQMRTHFVIVDPAERKKIILDETEKAAAAVGGKPLRNDELLEQVAFLTEYPTVVCGNFDFEYLKLPREVLVTTMISHQKYFPVVDGEGNLLPHFLTINNTLARDPVSRSAGERKGDPRPPGRRTVFLRGRPEDPPRESRRGTQKGHFPHPPGNLL